MKGKIPQTKVENHKFCVAFCSHCGFSYKYQEKCSDRTCSVCREKWGKARRKPILEFIKDRGRIYEMTLTLKNIPDELFNKHWIKQLRDSFTKLRHQVYFKDKIKAGFYVIHTTNKGRGWHIHLHVIYTGKFIEIKKLSSAWFNLTGAYRVHIQVAKTPSQAVDYLLSEFLALRGKLPLREEDRDSYNKAFKDTRIVQGFGICARLKIEAEKRKCEKCGKTDKWIYKQVPPGLRYEVIPDPGRSPPFRLHYPDHPSSEVQK